jgi:hypothetical protein
MKPGGVSGPILGSAAPTDYGTDGQPVTGQRRPHTAHGGRAGFPSSAQQGVVGGYPVDPKQQQQQQMYDGEEDGDAHVVAGARGMMRYRRNRASTMEAAGQGGSNGGGGGSSGGMPVQQQQLLPQGIGYGVGGAGAGAGAGGAPWAMYQTNGKPAVQVGVCALNCD